ncbi:MAG: CPBP family intramembrane glutamic endopeptidase [Gemmatimonadales bacterium]
MRVAILGSLGFILFGTFLFGLAVAPFASAFAGHTAEELARRPTIGLALLQGVGLLAAFALATWVVGVKVLRLNLRDLRWRAPLGAARGFGVGLVFGILPAAVAMLLGVVAGGAAWIPDGGSLAQYWGRIGLILVMLAPAALAEEVIFRGVPLVLLSRVLGRPAALVLLSIGFALAHVTNPDVTARALGNITLAGILLSLAFFSPGGMWAAFGAHLGWNMTLAALGAPVSGLPFDIPFVDYTMGGPAWLTGGAFGPEGGLLSTLAISSAIVLAAHWVRKHPT